MEAKHLGSILFSSCSVFFFSMSSCSVRSLISSSKLLLYFSSISNIESTIFIFLKQYSNWLKLTHTIILNGPLAHHPVLPAPVVDKVQQHREAQLVKNKIKTNYAKFIQFVKL